MKHIQLAKKEHLKQSYEILDSCRMDLSNKGISQWTNHYPTKESIAKDIENSEGYVYLEQGDVLAYMQICNRQDSEYANVPWRINTDNVLTVHRLAIAPKEQGKGLAHKMMDFAESFAKKNNFNAIRLDAYSKNLIALNFYENKGYYICGKTYFPHREYHFYCFEKAIS